MLLKVKLFFFPCLNLPTLTLLLPQDFKFFPVQIISSEHTTDFQGHWPLVQASFSPLTSLHSFPQQLQQKAELSSAVDVIPLSSPSDFITPGKMCWAAGWGLIGVNKSTSDTLREVELRIMDE